MTKEDWIEQAKDLQFLSIGCIMPHGNLYMSIEKAPFRGIGLNLGRHTIIKRTYGSKFLFHPLVIQWFTRVQ